MAGRGCRASSQNCPSARHGGSLPGKAAFCGYLSQKSVATIVRCKRRFERVSLNLSGKTSWNCTTLAHSVQKSYVAIFTANYAGLALNQNAHHYTHIPVKLILFKLQKKTCREYVIKLEFQKVFQIQLFAANGPSAFRLFRQPITSVFEGIWRVFQYSRPCMIRENLKSYLHVFPHFEHRLQPHPGKGATTWAQVHFQTYFSL